MKTRKRQKNSSNSKQEGGSVWTSFSDLFTSLSIIFLVMFVVAIVKLSLSAMEQQSFRDAKVSKVEKEETIKKRSKIKDSITKIDEKMKQLKVLSGSLNEHKDIMDGLLKEQVEKDKMLNAASDTLIENKVVIEDLKDLKSVMDKEIKKNIKEIATISNDYKIEKKLKEKVVEEKIILEQNLLTQTNELKKKVLEKSELEKVLEKQIKNINTQKKVLIEKEKEISEYAVKKKDSEQKINEMKKQANTLREEIELGLRSNKELSGTLKSKENERQKLNKKIGSLSDEKGELSKQLSASKGELGKMKNEFSNAMGNLSDIQGKYNDLQNSNSNLKSRIDGMSGKIAGLNNQINGLNGKVESLNGQVKECSLVEEKYNKLVKSNRNLIDKLSKKPKVVRMPASITKPKKCETAACALAGNIAKRLSSIDSNFKSDNTGKLVLKMDDTFGFQNDSSKLKEGVAEKLKKIIQVYAEELFRDPTVRAQIENVFIIGHASPRHKGKPIDLENSSSDHAYKYNLDLSANRALTIAKFIFSPDMGDFSHKNLFKNKLQASGRGYTAPVLRNVNVLENGCGVYDCARSRRVEIFFTLKGGDSNILMKKFTSAK